MWDLTICFCNIFELPRYFLLPEQSTRVHEGVYSLLLATFRPDRRHSVLEKTCYLVGSILYYWWWEGKGSVGEAKTNRNKNLMKPPKRSTFIFREGTKFLQTMRTRRRLIDSPVGRSCSGCLARVSTFSSCAVACSPRSYNYGFCPIQEGAHSHICSRTQQRKGGFEDNIGCAETRGKVSKHATERSARNCRWNRVEWYCRSTIKNLTTSTS